jgi:hypothetical protein
MRPAHRALIGVAAAVVGWNFAAPDGETISEGFDELLVKYPVLTTVAIIAVAGHVANRIPARADVISIGFVVVRKFRWQRVVVVVEA